MNPNSLSKVRSSLLATAKFLRTEAFDRRPALAYVGGWLGKDNLGDEVLLRGATRLFANHKLCHYDGGRVSFRLLSLRAKLRGGLLAGGTLIGHKRRWLEMAQTFMELNSAMAVFGTGVEEPVFWPGETTLRDWEPLLRRCGYVGVRGPISAEKLSTVGISAEVIGDPALAFAYDRINMSPLPLTLGLNIGVSDGKLWGDEQRVCDEMSRLALLARTAGWTVKWYVVWPKDLPITRKAALASRTEGEITVIYKDEGKFLRSVRDLTAFVGMKLHATILATCALTPSVMIEYRPKCRDYMQSIHQDEFTFRSDSFSAPKILEIVTAWSDARTDAATALLMAISRLKALQHDRAAEIGATFFGPRS